MIAVKTLAFAIRIALQPLEDKSMAAFYGIVKYGEIPEN